MKHKGLVSVPHGPGQWHDNPSSKCRTVVHCTPVHCARAGVSKPVDVASANGKAFLNMATGGFGTEAAKKTDSDLKDKVGGAAYAITGEL